MSSHPFCARYAAPRMRLLGALGVVLAAAFFLRPLRAAATPPAPPTSLFFPIAGARFHRYPPSDDMIDAALARGEIDAETALVYKVYVAFNDPRLPQPYRGDDSDIRDSMIVAEVSDRFDSLSAQAQALLAPFLLPPSGSGSWLEQRQAAAQGQAGGREPAAIAWKQVPAMGNKAAVWYELRYAGDEAVAKEVAQELSANVWPDLTGLMGREPLSDAGLNDNGGDGRFDVYLVHFPPPTDPNKGATMGQAPAYDPKKSGGRTGCKETPSYLLVDSRLSGADLKATLAHEFMHAIQWSYPVSVGCMAPGEYAWFAEASATWAEHYVYSTNQTEQEYARFFLNRPERSLEDPGGRLRVYGAYLWPFYLTQGQAWPDKPAVIRSIWEAFATNTSLAAIDKSIPGGFKQQWAGFTLRNWNTDPVTDYRDWDELSWGIPSGQVLDLNSALVGKRAVRETPLVETIPYLAAKYYRIDLKDPAIHRLTFFNGLHYKLSEATVTHSLGRSWVNDQVTWRTLHWSEASEDNQKYVNIWAIPMVAGVWQEPEDLTNLPYRTFCRDKLDENLDALILVISNSAWDKKDYTPQPDDKAPTLFYSNIPCDGWQGDFHGVAPLNEYPLPVSAAGVKLTPDHLWEGGLAGGAYLIGNSYTASQGQFNATASFDVYGNCHVNMDYHAPVVGSMVVNEFALDDAFGRYTVYFKDEHINGPMHCDDGTTGVFPDPMRGVWIWYLWVAAEDPPGLNRPPTIRVLEPMHVSDDGQQMRGDKSITWNGTPVRTYEYHWGFAPDTGP
ncbi:MAG: hypothetical protein K1X65_08815 [Caldilineales bacterium]|nr:hypothetical protein [Caldilineales bacterium]MCW5857600.1 hypothetical protein [Caldilineales bacterium]